MGLNLNEIKAQQAAQSTAGKPFTPKAKADRPAAAQSEPTAAQPTDLNQVAQSEAMTIRESVNLSAGTGTRALQALSTQRDNTQQAIAAEIERLTNPELFFTETIAIAAEKIRSREQQREQVSFELDFFDVASVTASLPAPRPLPQVQTVKSLSSAG